MSIERVKQYLSGFGLADRIHVFEDSSATVALAAERLHCEPGNITKTLAFQGETGPILIAAAGDAHVDNARFKAQFGCKAKMLPADTLEAAVGYAVGGVCPFAVNEGVPVYLDASLKRFETVYPAAGTPDSAVAVTIPELEAASHFIAWVDVCKGWPRTEAAE